MFVWPDLNVRQTKHRLWDPQNYKNVLDQLYKLCMNKP